ncbi:MAG: DUF3426 domain-containing protein [Pseudoxanthomonas sp.]|nr:DUF3426 domain-containing protein [Pseudoxanthomonas sp.]
MFVPCPHCQFLVAHHPQLRPLPDGCPRCGKPLQEDGEAVPVTDGTTLAVDDGPGPADDTGMAVSELPTPVETASIATPPVLAPRPGRWSRWRWPLVALLGLLLALQILLADRAHLAADPRWRPLLETVCGTLRCSLPAWHEPAAFTMLDRKVRPAPQAPGALRIDATFRNDARWPQPWPALQLALSDADGRVLGSRVFQPADYLGAAPTTLLSPGQSAQITFVVREPAPGTVAFSFEFR